MINEISNVKYVKIMNYHKILRNVKTVLLIVSFVRCRLGHDTGLYGKKWGEGGVIF